MRNSDGSKPVRSIGTPLCHTMTASLSASNRASESKSEGKLGYGLECDSMHAAGSGGLREQVDTPHSDGHPPIIKGQTARPYPSCRIPKHDLRAKKRSHGDHRPDEVGIATQGDGLRNICELPNNLQCRLKARCCSRFMQP